MLSPRRRTLFAIIFLLLLTLAVIAGPIFADRNQYPDELLALANITEVAIEINPLPMEFTEAGITADKIRDKVKARLTQAGYTVVEGDFSPRLSFTALTLTDPSVPDTVGFVVFFDVVQHIRIHRLDRDFVMPTSTLSAQGVRSRKLLNDGVMKELDNTLDKFIEWEKLATENQ